MLAAAAIAAAKAHATAIGAQKKIADLRGPDLDWSVRNAQPSPPVNLPALSSIKGPSHMERVRVVGYQIEQLDLGEIELEEPTQAEGLPRPRG